MTGKRVIITSSSISKREKPPCSDSLALCAARGGGGMGEDCIVTSWVGALEAMAARGFVQWIQDSSRRVDDEARVPYVVSSSQREFAPSAVCGSR